ncbi:DNA polymerase III subunit gamma/tau [Sphingomonas oryzagri]|uniref:DNA polymerase III subunit gamma/tau n=1 Tax=Sphingomonas oryzagri TaxID=3042314 RepID=A0ABT6MZP4_9SPHN|nr:DNA polymerase III subunit gamma/tau [Sphingomonas oryzagri]MDH7638530.1 DNA polymerase III subunit gamma/tau [Sphingomonas oryzagri]
MSESPTPYRVLARKYRPQTFDQLIGQDAMVQTLENAIKRGRIAHAFLMTGVRGVGKTSTARLIAKSLNCVGPDGQGGPTISACGICDPCQAIAEGRHIDVIEMDAASHTGVDDMRNIIEAARLAAFSARFKIYIIDEVHMLSKNAFNALLKTLEEPPEHVKFLLATTEVNKVPITVLSRCQRFDLRRIPAELLAKHFQHVVDEEQISAEPEALALIARAAEGSARDGLSILDQAIAHAGTDAGGVTAVQVREMLGLSDRGAVRRLFALLLSGDAPAVLAALAEQHALGVEPAALFRGLLEAVHGVTRAKAGGAPDPAQSVEERAALEEWAGKLGHATLHRLWQLLLKGLSEVETTAMPMEAAEMALLRVVHAGTLPDPGELLRKLQSGEPMPALDAAAPVAGGGAPVMAAPVMPAVRLPADFPALIEGVASRHAHLAQQLHDYASLVRYAPPELAIHPKRPIDGNIAKALGEVFSIEWKVALADQPGEPTLREQELAAKAAAEQEILDSPVVAAIRTAFPGAELIEDERSIA